MDTSYKDSYPQNSEYPSSYSYNGNPDIKRSNVELQWTPEMIQEYKKCSEDPIYFIKRWMTVFNVDHGMVPFDLYDFQEEMVEHFSENRFSILLAARQIGKTTVVAGYILHRALFSSKPEKIVIVANKASAAKEVLERVMDALEQVPFFLQLGCDEYNKSSIRFENKTKIIAAATSSNTVRGKSASILYIDEAAFIDDAESFYTSTYPVVSSGKESQIIITSTANGIGNLFHTLWTGATTKSNNYGAMRVDWHQVPGRDEEWKRETISNTSAYQFEQEFGNNFHGTGNTLISSDIILGMMGLEPTYIKDNVRLYEEPIEGHEYCMAVDVAKGRGQDYSTFQLIDITSRPFTQVGTLRDCLISPLLLPSVLEKYAKMYNNAFVIIESNDQGTMVCNGLYYDLEYENVYVSSMVKSGGVGLEMNKKIKRIGCSNLKDLVEEKKLTIVDKDTIQEISTFAASGVSYQATEGNHDDLVMALVGFSYVATLPVFSEMTDMDVKSMLYEQHMKHIEDSVVPFGIINDHQEETHMVDSTGQVWEIDEGDDTVFSGNW